MRFSQGPEVLCEFWNPDFEIHLQPAGYFTYFSRRIDSMRFRPHQYFIIIFIINLLQSILTPIARDEAYYWMFGQNLDWGFFDHPPMVALMTFLGSVLFNGTLGVRLITSIMSAFTAYFTWLLLPEESRKKDGVALIFTLVFMASPLMNLYGFITTPDVPLLFFTGAYLLIFKRFHREQNIRNSLLLGLMMSMLIYSKYHGILVILISAMAHYRLFRKPWIWLAGIFGVLLYLPHLWWQYDHDFVSFKYHLFYRSTEFEWSNILEYLLNFILVMNPFLVYFFIRGLRKSRGRVIDPLLGSIFWGIFGFFLLTSARGHVEPHWVAIACIPFVVFIVHQAAQSGASTGLKALAGICIFLIFTLRIILLLPLDIKSEFHMEKEAFYKDIRKTARGRKVVFTNSYTHAAKYSFYTGEPTFSYNFISYRRNQYDLLNIHPEFHLKNSTVITFWPLDRFEKRTCSEREEYFYKDFDSLEVINNLHVEILDYPKEVKEGESCDISLRLTNPYKDDIDFRRPGSPVLWELYFFYLDKERLGGVSLEKVPLKTIKAESQAVIHCKFSVKPPPGRYTIGVALRPWSLFPISVSDRTYPIEVTEY